MTEQPVTMADPTSPAEYPEPAGVETRSAVMLIAGFSAVLLVVLTFVLPVKYAVLQPGPVLNTLGPANGKPLIVVTGHPTYPTNGQLDLTTVSVVGGPNRKVLLLQMLGGWLSRKSAAVPQGSIFPAGVTAKQSEAENQAEMTNSQESATAAALSALNIPVPTTLTVAGTQSGSPSAKVLKKSDVILAVNGTKVADLAALRTVLQTVTPGDRVTVTVRRAGAERTVSTLTGTADDGHTVLGIFIDPTFSFPFSVKIQIEDIGGPSAGMMFALGIIDTLTPGDLTGGKRIAGTGEIDADGSVHPIGGIRQKLVGARQAGARYFIAPAENCDEVRGHIPSGLQVVKTATLTQSRDEVTAIAAGRTADLPHC